MNVAPGFGFTVKVGGVGHVTPAEEAPAEVPQDEQPARAQEVTTTKEG